LLRERHRLGWGLLGAAVAAKLWPFVIAPLALTWSYRAGRSRAALVGVGVAAIAFVPFAIVAPHGLWESLRGQASRPLQIESLGASLFTVFGHPRVITTHGSQNIAGHGGIGAVFALVQIATLVALWAAFADGPATSTRLLRYSAAAVCAFVAFGKVLSPQFLLWLIPLVPLVRGRRGIAATALLTTALVLTQVRFPDRYFDYVDSFHDAGVVLARNVALVGLLPVLAGLVCAYRLQQAGFAAQVFEASGRIGGRCFTGRGDFADGQIYEHGGELIDNGHIDLKQLAGELGFTLDNLLQGETNGTEQLGYFFGKQYTFAQMTDDLKTIWQQIHSDTSAAGYPTLYNSFTTRGQQLDQMSLYQWIENFVPGGHGSSLGQMLDVAYNIEYGAETTVQSSLNMLYLLGFVGPGQFRTFGKSNEKFHVHGGNDQVATTLAARLGSQLTTNTPLTAIKLNNDGTYTLTFANRSGSITRTADHL